MSYEITKSDGVTTLITLGDGEIDNYTTSLTFVGKNTVGYGEIQNENFLRLLENFAHTGTPRSPIKGQTWFDSNTATNGLKVYNGSTWSRLAGILYNNTVTTTQYPGDLFWDTTNRALYIKSSTSTYSIIGGPSVASDSARKLTTPVTINGVSFDGSANVTIASTTTNTLVRGSYLTGSDFNGGTTTTWAVDVGTITSATAYKVVARDNIGDIWFNVGHGTATAARYADLAEKYLADKDYEPGTVVRVGGEKEITAGAIGKKSIGVVSTNPGYMMNSDLEGGTYIALKGRVPVKVKGPVNKEDELVPSDDGYAMARGDNNFHLVFAVALESIDHDGIIEAVIL